MDEHVDREIARMERAARHPVAAKVTEFVTWTFLGMVGVTVGALVALVCVWVLKTAASLIL